jgi:2,3-bisphosphoglycerate-independent phosphoglycerate mutase
VKYAIVILSGAADRPCRDLDGLTPLAAANKPAIDTVARTGRQGTVRTVGEASLAGSAAGLCTLLGVAIRPDGEGFSGPSDGQLRAMASGIDLQPDDLALRLDLVCTSEADSEDDDQRAVLTAHLPPQLSTAEARTLLTDLQAFWKEHLPERAELLSRLSVHVGSRGAHLLVDHGGAIAKALGEGPLRCAEPETILGQPWQDAAPRGAAGELVAELMEASHACFRDHEINRTRIEGGLMPVSMAWISGLPVLGACTLPRFLDTFGLRAAMVSRSPAAIGLGAALALDCIALPETQDLSERITSLGEYARSAIDRYDLVIIETSAVAEASLAGDAHGAMEAIDLIDRHILTPLLARLEDEGDNEHTPDEPGSRCLIACDRTISTDERSPRPDAVPFAMAGSWVRAVVHGPMSEREAQHCDLHIESGHDLMEYFLFSGLKRPRSTRRRSQTSRSAPAPDS